MSRPLTMSPYSHFRDGRLEESLARRMGLRTTRGSLFRGFPSPVHELLAPMPSSASRRNTSAASQSVMGKSASSFGFASRTRFSSADFVAIHETPSPLRDGPGVVLPNLIQVSTAWRSAWLASLPARWPTPRIVS